MQEQGSTPRYAIRLVAVVVIAALVFFLGLRLFVPEGSKLTGSYDAQSLPYIAAAPLAYASNSQSCGSVNCHSTVYETWAKGAHGARQEQSKCEVCHGPQGDHPKQTKKLPKVRGDGDVVELCLVCHARLKARQNTGQPQIVAQEHPAPHEGVLKCTQCHNPHSPGIGAGTVSQQGETPEVQAPAADKNGAKKTDAGADAAALAAPCFSCHGANGRGGFAPPIAAQSAATLSDRLNQFRSGELKGTLMNPIAAKLSDQEITALAKYLAGLP